MEEVVKKHVKMLSDLLSTIRAADMLGNELEKLLSSVVLKVEHKRFDFLHVIVAIESRKLMRYKLAPLRCEEDTIDGFTPTISKVSLMCGESDCWIQLLDEQNRSYDSIWLSRVLVADVLKLACNITLEEMERLIEAVREKIKQLEGDMIKLKELIAYSSNNVFQSPRSSGILCEYHSCVSRGAL